MENDINNLRVLVDLVLKRIKRDAEKKDFHVITELLWHVPTNVLQTYVKRED